MRSLFAVTLILLGSGVAHAEWMTRVTDSSAAGIRMVELIGTPAGDHDHGIVLLCFPDSPGDAALVYAAEATKDYAKRPGDAVSIIVGPAQFEAELTANDSFGTSATATSVSPAAVIKTLNESGWAVSVKLDGVGESAMTISSPGYENAMAEFSSACTNPSI